MKNDLAVLIMAAGQGKRMNDPGRAKVMHALAGIPLIEHVVRLARRSDPARIIAIVGHRRESVIDHLKAVDPGVEIAVQAEQLGTGHAVRRAAALLEDFSGDILILSGDAPLTRLETIRSMLNIHRESGAVATVLTAVLPEPDGYGRIIRDNAGRISKIVEHKDASADELAVREINSGIYVFRKRELFDALLQTSNDNAQGEYYLPDVFRIYARNGYHVEPYPVESFDEIRGVNTAGQLQEMEILYRAMQHRQ